MARTLAIVYGFVLLVAVAVAVAVGAHASYDAPAPAAPRTCFAPCTVVFATGTAEDNYIADYVGASQSRDNRARLRVSYTKGN